MGGKLGHELEDIVQRFNAQNPDITVRLEYMGSYASLRQKIIASLAAGNFPDMAQSFETWTGKFVNAGKIATLTQFFNGPYGLTAAEIDDFFPFLRAANTYNGELWALPFNKSVPVIYYNSDMLKKAGLGPPADDWTWADFLDYARVLTVRNEQNSRPEQYGFANSLSEWLFQCLLHQNGGSEFDPTERRVTYAQPPGITALKFMIGLTDTEKVAYYSTGFNNQNDFAAQKVGFIFSSCATRIYLEPVLQFNWNCAPVPRGPKPAVTVSGTNIVIFNQSSSNRMIAAWRFARYFSSPEVTLGWSLKTGYLPVRRSAVQSAEMARAISQNPRIQASLTQLAYCVPSPKHETWAKGRDLLITALEESMIGNVPPEKSLPAAAQKTQKLLDRFHEH